jgi:O-antigen/teichoic acid export membrane protein
VPAGAALWAVNLIDRPILAGLEGAAALGIYAISYKLVQAVMFLVQAFQLSWPAFAHSIRDDAEARRTYAWVLTLYVAGMAWAVVALGLVAPWLVRILTEPAFWDATDAVVPLAAGAACYGAYFVVGIGAARMKKTRLNWAIVLVAVGVEVAACYALIPPFGIVGAGWATALAYGTMLVLKAFYAQHHFPVPYPWLRMARAVAVAALVLLGGLSLTADDGAAALAVRIGLVIAFPALVLATGFLSRSELRIAVAHARRRGPARDVRPA